MNLFLIYIEFFKIGLFAVGGGLATLPFLFRMADGYSSFIHQTEQLSREAVGNFIAIAQSSPGAIGVNIAAQTGFRIAGIAGGLCAAVGLVSPAIWFIIVIARILREFKESRIVVSVFSGLRPAAGGLLTAAGFGIWKLCLYNSNGTQWYEIFRLKEFAVCAVLFILIRKIKGHPVIYIAAGALTGILLGF